MAENIRNPAHCLQLKLDEHEGQADYALRLLESGEGKKFVGTDKLLAGCMACQAYCTLEIDSEFRIIGTAAAKALPYVQAHCLLDVPEINSP